MDNKQTKALDPNARLGWGERIGYGVGATGWNMINGIIGTFLTVYFTNVAFLDAAIISTLIAVSKVFDGEPDELFDQISAEMHGDWVRFAKTSDPNPDWGRFEGPDSPVRIFDRETRTERLDRRHLMQIWGDMRFYEL